MPTDTNTDHYTRRPNGGHWCTKCGSHVEDTLLHTAWHERLAAQMRSRA